ncbi:unnamed protein product [Gongylonema pulchrum]|uniref:Uncharacterized protein n=1 Tax=Gongylonema pulchrum TaxID=637853 RepID=A0A183DY42_9BILA|nr:unnamed protein product [Gongylonema pulchrum]
MSISRKHHRRQLIEICINILYCYSELPDLPKITTSGQYFEFEQIVNGADGNFDGNSDSDSEGFGEHEDDSFSFNMCRVRRLRRMSNSPPKIYSRVMRDNGQAVQHTLASFTLHHQRDEEIRKVEEEGLDPEDIFCTVSEDDAGTPPLAQEDDFDDIDV